MNYKKYRIDFGSNKFRDLVYEFDSIGMVVVVGIRFEGINSESRELKIEDFNNSVRNIGNFMYYEYERFPLFIALINNTEEFLKKWNLIRRYFIETRIFLISDQITDDPDTIYETYFKTNLSNSLLTITNNIWKKRLSENLLFQAPCVILADSTNDWGPVGIPSEALLPTSFKNIFNLINKE